MKVQILKEAGYDEAILGLSLSKGTSIERAKEVAIILANKDGGHNKVLESIYIWLDISAPRYWWQEADTYRISTKQSESTMYTIQKRCLTQKDFQDKIHETTLEIINNRIQMYNSSKLIGDLVQLKNELPEGFLQRRIWVMNYKCMRNILLQRTTHRLPLWKSFCSYIRQTIEHPELLPE